MSASKPIQPIDRQGELAFDEPDPILRDMDAINHRLVCSSYKRWRQLRELVAAIRYCGLNDGCRASVAALLDVANRNRSTPIIKSISTFHRVRRLGVQHGIIAGEFSYDDEGRTFSERAINAPRIAELLELSRRLKAAERAKKRSRGTTRRQLTEASQNAKSDTNLALTCNKPSIALKPLKPSKPNTVDPAKGDQGWTEDRISDVRTRCRTASGKLLTAGLRCRREEDRSLLCKSAYLSFAKLNERWFFGAVEGLVLSTTDKPRPWGWLHQTWSNSLPAACGGERPTDLEKAHNRRLFNGLLARVRRVPAELLELPAGDDELRERLCTSARET
jgi:hypothetical protein